MTPTPIRRVLLLMALLLTAPATAWAHDVDPDPPHERPLYGLAMAGAYVVAPVAGLMSAAKLGPEAGFAVFALTPPIVHLAYAEPWWAVAALFAPTASTVGTSLLIVALSRCDWGILGGGTCGGPMTAGAALGYLAWAVFDITMSSLRGGHGLHDSSKHPPQPVHEPRIPAARPTASVGQCAIDRIRG